MSRRPTPVELAGGVTIAVLVAGFALLPQAEGLRTALLATLGLAVLVLPGIALALIRRPSTRARRLTLAVGAGAASIGVLVVGALVLNLLPGGLDRTSWLGLVAALAVATAALARGGLPELRLDAVKLPRRIDAAAMIAAIAVAILALGTARADVRSAAEPTTALWVIPSSDGLIEIGVDNDEGVAREYQLDVTVNGEVRRRFPWFTVETGLRWTAFMTAPSPDDPRYEIRLFVPEQPDEPYRLVTITSGTVVPPGG